ncbi:MAG: AmmeMemoRadiSam system protein B [Gammaproteobacteria bacterium]|nr:AmmeMemoRadiSam system protein B [Gammaproteobacteria bacterium]MCZ6488381.1 AmmeMemoRadiSam system protein B [Gammaproteobacteria bacterium]
MSTREAAVAGSFYEAQTADLRQQVNQFVAQSPEVSSVKPKVLIVPHAGYVYSGSTAAQAYRSLESQRDGIRRVVLLGPAHRVYLEGMAVPSVDTFSTPLGEVQLDARAIEQILTLPGVIVSDEAHREEHSLEVQLPFLQSVLKQFTLVPIVVGHCDAKTVAAVIDELWGGLDTLVVISTDLSHFHSYEAARQIDASTCDRILQKSSDLSGEQACGARVVNGLMSSEHSRSLDVELLSACNSGDTAGSRDRVVGYGAFLLH